MYVLPSDPVPEDSGHTVLSMLVQEIPLQDSYPKWPCRSLRFSRFWHTEFRIDLGPVNCHFSCIGHVITSVLVALWSQIPQPTQQKSYFLSLLSPGARFPSTQTHVWAGLLHRLKGRLVATWSMNMKVFPMTVTSPWGTKPEGRFAACHVIPGSHMCIF